MRPNATSSAPRRLLTGRRIATILVLMVLLLPALLYSLWWWQAARTVRDGLESWVADQRANGAVVEHGGLTVGGFPFTLRAELAKLHLATRGADWQGAGLVAEAAPWNPTRIALTFPGEQRLSVVQPGQPPIDILAPQGGSGDVTMRMSGTLERLALHFTGLTAQVAGQPVPVAALDVSAAQPDRPPAERGTAGLTVTLSADGLTLPDGMPPTLGREVKRTEMALRVMGDEVYSGQVTVGAGDRAAVHRLPRPQPDETVARPVAAQGGDHAHAGAVAGGGDGRVGGIAAEPLQIVPAAIGLRRQLGKFQHRLSHAEQVGGHQRAPPAAAAIAAPAAPVIAARSPAAMRASSTSAPPMPTNAAPAAR